MLSARDLFDYQSLYIDARKAYETAASGAAKYKELIAKGGVYDNANNAAGVARYEKDAADEAEKMKRFAEASSRIVARGDPSLTTAGIEVARLKRQADRSPRSGGG